MPDRQGIVDRRGGSDHPAERNAEGSRELRNGDAGADRDRIQKMPAPFEDELGSGRQRQRADEFPASLAEALEQLHTFGAAPGRPRFDPVFPAQPPGARSRTRACLPLTSVGAGQESDDRFARLLVIHVELEQDVRGDPVVLPEEPEQDVLRPDVVATERERLPERELEHLLRPRRERDLAARHLLARPDDQRDPRPNLANGHAEELEYPRRQSLFHAQESEQQVLGPDVVMVQSPCLFLRKHDHLARTLGESLEHARNRTAARRPVPFAAVVTATKLTKRYGEKRVLNKVDVELASPGFLVVTGPNGSGKTTLLRVLAGLDAPSAGEVVLPERGTIGYLGHEPLVYRELTPLENLHLFGRLYRVPERGERIGMLLERFGLWEARDRRVSTFSRGMRQRLGLCRVLLHEPGLVILDEPFNALDEAGSTLLDATLDELAPHSAVIVATHDPVRVERLATQRLAFA